MIAGSLEIQMLANMAELKKQMDQGVGIVKGASEQMQKAAELAGKALGMIGVGLSVGAFTGFIKNAIDAADALDEMSGRVGVSAKELSQLQLAYKQAGIANDGMASSLNKLSKEMADGNVGLRALSINARNADGTLKSTTTVLMEVADKFQGLEDGAGKTALAMEIFGKSGAEMIPLLNAGSEGIRELTEMSEKLGLVIEDETAAQAGQFNDTLELLQLGVQGVGSKVAAQLLPTLNNLTGSFLENMTQGDRLSRVSDVLAASMKGLFSAGVIGIEIFNTLGKGIGAVVGGILAVLRGDFAEAKGIMAEAKADILGGWKVSAESISAAWNSESNSSVAAAAAIVKSNSDLLAGQKAREEGSKKAADAAAKAAADQAKYVADSVKLMDGLLAQDSGLSPDFQEKWDKLIAAHKKAGRSIEDLQEAQAALLAQQPGIKKNLEEEAAAVKALYDERQKSINATFESAKSLEEGNQQLRDEIQLIGKSRQEQAAILRSRRESIILIKEATLAEMERASAITGTQTKQEIALAEEIAQLKERNELLSMKGVAEEAAATQEQVRNETTSTLKQVEDWFTSSFLDMINNGKDGWKAMCQSLKNSFLTLVAKEIYAALSKPFVVQLIGSLMGLTGTAVAGDVASAVGGSSGILGTANNASSLYSIGGAIWQGFTGAAVGASTASLVGANLVGAVGGDALGTLIALNGGWAGVSATGGAVAAGAATGATAAGTTAAAGTGTLASSLSAIPVWGWIAAAIVVALGFIIGNDDSGTPHVGSVGSYSEAEGYRQVQNGMELGDNSIDMGMYYGGEEMAKIPETVSKGIVGVLDGIAGVFGKDKGYSVTTGFADDGSDDGAWGGLRIQGPDGKDLINWDDGKGKWAPREFSSGEDGLNEYLDAVATDTRKVLMESMDLPSWAKDIVGSVKEEDFDLDALQAVVTQIAQVQAVFDGLADTLVGFGNLSSEAMGKMAAASGGVDKLSANASSYYQNFYTEEERVAKQREAVNKSLKGLGLDEIDLSAADAREQFRALVEEQLALGDSSAETVAALLSLSDAVAGVTTATEDAAEAARQKAEADAQAAQELREQALTAAGLSVDSLVDGFLNEVNNGRGAQAGVWLADTIAAGFEQAIYGQALSIIMNSIIDGVITPVVTAAMTGSSVSAAVSSAAIDTMVANATAAADALVTLLNDPAFKDAIAKVLGIVKDLGNSIGASIPPMTTYKAATTSVATSYTNVTSTANDAAKAAETLAKTMASLGDSIVEEIKRIRGLIAGDGADGFALAQSRFDEATLKARAGDEEAAKALPGLSRDLLELAKSNVRTSADLKYFQATTAASLQATVEAMAGKFGFDVPAFADGGFHAGGWALVGERGPELAYMPPAQIYTAPQTLAMQNGGSSNDGWYYLAEELGKTNERLRNVERFTRKTAETLDGWDRAGQPKERKEAA